MAIPAAVKQRHFDVNCFALCVCVALCLVICVAVAVAVRAAPVAAVIACSAVVKLRAESSNGRNGDGQTVKL